MIRSWGSGWHHRSFYRTYGTRGYSSAPIHPPSNLGRVITATANTTDSTVTVTDSISTSDGRTGAGANSVVGDFSDALGVCCSFGSRDENDDDDVSLHCSTRASKGGLASSVFHGKRARKQHADTVSIMSLNGTSFSAALDFASQDKSALFLCQEMLRGRDKERQCTKEANREGLHCSIHGSCKTEQGGLSAGVAIFSQYCSSLVSFPAVEGVPLRFYERFVYNLWYAVEKGGLAVGSVYLISGAKAGPLTSTF